MQRASYYAVIGLLVLGAAACKGSSSSSPATGAIDPGPAGGPGEPGGAAVAASAVAASAAGNAAGSAAPPADVPAKVPTPAARPAAFAEFEAVLLPLVGAPPGDERSRKTCAQLMTLQSKSLAVRRSMPAGVDEAAWKAASNGMRGTLEGLGPICNDDPPDDEDELAAMHRFYQQLVALLPS